MPDQTPEEIQTAQDRPDALIGDALQPYGQRSFMLTLMSEEDGIPPYWSRNRDAWLREFVLRPGNDLLAGTVATVSAKVATMNWFIEGPERTANIYRQILLTRSGFNAGWSRFIQSYAWDYLTQDQAGWCERIRQHSGYVTNPANNYDMATNLDTKGGAIGFANLDNARMLASGDPDYPAVYTPEEGNDVLLHRSQVMRIVDSQSPQETLYGVGYCAVSRAITTARILMDVARYERERLSDLPPTGILMINNMSPKQWEDIEKQYSMKQRQQGNKVWRDILVAMGLDPALPVSAELLSFSELPEHFDKKTTTEIGVYAFALAFRIDPREIWPVSTGSMGTATETEIMHVKARAKGAGLILTDIERGFNDGNSLPKSLRFSFDFQDTEEDKQSAEIANLKADFINKLTTPDNVTGEALVSKDEGRAWLVKQGLFEEQDLLVMQETDMRAEDVSKTVDLGPISRVYRDGRVVRLEKRPQVWRGHSVDGVLKAVAENYVAGQITEEQLLENFVGGVVDRVA